MKTLPIQKILVASILSIFLGIFFFIGVKESTAQKNFSGTEGFRFIIQKITEQKNTYNMLKSNISFTRIYATAFKHTNLYTLGLQNRGFILARFQEHQRITSDSGIITHKNTISQIGNINIWKFLESEKNREIYLEKYIQTAKFYLKEGQTQEKILSTKIKSLKTTIYSQKKKISTDQKLYKKILTARSQNAIFVADHQQKIIKERTILAQMETEYQKLSILHQQYLKEKNNLTKKIQAIEENYEALVKNVRVKKSSGAFIEAIIE